MAFCSCFLMVDEREERERSIEVAGFQGGVGLIDDLQLLLSRLVAAMRVGMMQFDEGLVPRLKTNLSKGRLDFEDAESLLTCGQCATLGVGRAGSVSPPPIARSPGAPGEHPEIVANSLGIAGTVTISQAPARALPDRVAPDLGLDFAIAHAGIVVPRRIVGADMIEAEPIVVAKFKSGFRRAELSTTNATGVVA